jgi:hypothetical protein
MMDSFRFQETGAALLRTVAYFDAIDYAPTWGEASSWLEWSGARGFEQIAPPDARELAAVRSALEEDGRLESGFGRLALPGRLAVLAALSLERTTLFARKIRRARRVARHLARLASVRFVALVNTTALAHARDAADLDFFVVVRHGRLWTSRLLSAGPYRMLGKLASTDGESDAICLSYFVSDAGPDLGGHMLAPDDPYFRYWFLSMLPFYDDGVSRELWEANAQITALHPRAHRWIIPDDLAVKRPRLRFPDTNLFESLASRIQTAWFPSRIRERMNGEDRSVIVTDQALKFHVDDARVRFREAYEERLSRLGV